MPNLALVDEVTLTVVGDINLNVAFTKTVAVPYPAEVVGGGFRVKIDGVNGTAFTYQTELDASAIQATFGPFATGEYVATVMRVDSLGGQLGDAVTSAIASVVSAAEELSGSALLVDGGKPLVAYNGGPRFVF